MKRGAVGIKVIAIVNILIGLGLFINMFITYSFSKIAAPKWELIPLSILLLLGSTFIVYGISIYRLNFRARQNNISLSILGIILTLAASSMCVKTYEHLVCISFLVYFIWVWFYLARPIIKEQFK